MLGYSRELLLHRSGGRSLTHSTLPYQGSASGGALQDVLNLQLSAQFIIRFHSDVNRVLTID